MFIVEKFINLLQERWKYLLGAYMVGYFISIMQSGVPNLYYLIPLKPYSILFGWALGNGAFQVLKEQKRRGGARLPMYMNFYFGIKYGIPALLFTGIFYVLLTFICFIFKIDSTPFTAGLK